MISDISIVGDQKIHFPLIGRSTSSGPYNPADDPRVKFWIDAQASSTLFQDEEKTTPALASASDPVAAWEDRSGNGWTMLSPDAVPGGSTANRPTIIENGINTFDGIATDGVAAFMRNHAGITIVGNKLTAFIVTRRATFTDANEAFLSLAPVSRDDHSDTKGVVIGHSPGVPNSFALSDSRLDETLCELTHPADLVSFIYESVYDGTNQVAAINGVEGTPVSNAGTGGDFEIDFACLGFRNDTGGFEISKPNNRIYGEIIIYDIDLSSADRLLVRQYQATKWGITLP